MKYELKKLLSLRFFPVFLLLLFLANGVAAYLSAPSDPPFQTILKTFFTDYEKDPASYDQGYQAYLWAKTLAVEQQIQALEKGEDPMKYAFQDPVTLYPESGYTDGELYTALYARKGYPEELRTRLEAVIQTAEKNLQVVTDPYRRTYLARVIETYRPMTRLSVSTAYLNGWDAFLEYEGTGYFLMALILVCAMLLASADREEATESLLFSTCKGCCGVLLQKLSALLVLSACGTLLLELSALAGISVGTPMGGIRAFVQSFSSFALCPYPLYVYEAVCLRFLLRITVSFGVGTLLMLLARVLPNRFMFLVASAGIIALQLWWDDPAVASVGSPGETLNLFALLSGEGLLTRYTAVNLFGACVSVPWAITALLAGITFLSICLLFLLWRKRIVRPRRKKRRPAFCYIPKTLAGFEAKKLFLRSGLLLPILVLLVVKLLLPPPPLTYRDRLYRTYMTELEGELTPEKEACLAEEKASFHDLFAKEAEYTLLYEKGEISYEELASLRMEIHSARIRYEVFLEVEQEAARVKALNEEGVPALLLYPKGWQSLLFGAPDLLFLLLLLLPSFAYAPEARFHFLPIQNASAKGSGTTFVTKLFLCTAVTAGMGILFFLADLYKLSALHTLPVPGTVLASLPGKDGTLPLAGCVILALLFRTLLAALACTAGVLLSRRFRHPALPPLLMTGLLLLICLSAFL